MALTLGNLGNAHGALGDNSKKCELLERALPIWTRAYGTDHPQTEMCQEQLDIARSDLGFPLHAAAKRGDVDAIKQFFLDDGAEVDRANEKGRTPLWIACLKGHVEVARLLLEKGAEVDRVSKKGVTPLLIACQQGHVDTARLLLDKGAKVDRAEKEGATPLYIACRKGHVEAVRLLLDNGAEVDRAKENGETPLCVAKRKGHAAVVALLEEVRET